jgi:DNA-binding MarR family transcriptional regulator
MDSAQQAQNDSPPALRQQIVELILAVLGEVKHAVVQAATAFDLTPQQAHLLHVLDRPCRMRDLAEVLHCDPSNVTGLVDRVERRDLVRRDSDPDDRRSKRLVLTEHGRAVRADLQRRVLAGLPITAGLSVYQAEQLRDLLATVVSTVGSNGSGPVRPRAAAPVPVLGGDSA